MKRINELQMIFPMALRNIKRNIRRTVLSGSTILLAAAAMCLMFGFQNAIIDDMKLNIVNHVTGQIRVRNALFTENERIQPLQFYVPQTKQFVEQAEKIEGITLAAPKITAGAALYIDNEIKQAMAVGVDFSASRFFSGPNTIVLDGELPAGTVRANLEQQDRDVRSQSDDVHSATTDVKTNSDPLRDSSSRRTLPQAVITEGLAHRLNIKAGGKFTFMAPTATGGTNGITVQTAAVVHIGDTEFNNSAFFLDWQVLSQMLRMQGGATEVLIYVDENLSARRINEIVDELKAIYTNLDNMPQQIDGARGEILEWTNVSMMYQIFQLVDIIYLFMLMIFFLLASTVIFNTTMMSVLERKREIGTLMSLGMEPSLVMRLFLLETTCIACIASLLGVLCGAAGVALMGKTGFDLGAMGGDSISGMNLSSWIYPRLNAARYIMIFIIGTVTATAACIIPARMTMKVQPAEALRSEN